MTGGEAGGAVVCSGLGLGLAFVMLQALRRRLPIAASVQALADKEGVDVDVYALARVCASEAGGQKRIAKAAVAWVVVNEAVRVGSTPLQVVLGAAVDFGHQGEGGRGFVASTRIPQTVDFEVAGGVWNRSIADPTDGALNFDSPHAYKDKLDSDGLVVLTAMERADAFAANREGEGKSLLTLEGVPESTFRFWRRA